jgi:hypothetical protein
MKKWALLLIVLAAGCRHKHLGPDVGVAYREAFATQEQSEPTQEPTFGADVAHGTLGARKGGKAAGASSGSSEAIVVPMSTTTTSSSGAWPGASGNISLEAK